MGSQVRKIEFVLKGQIPSGKNQVNRDPVNGHPYPNKRFELWRRGACLQLAGQKVCWQRLESPCRVLVRYWAGNLQRRDITGMEDALCHLLEYMEVLKDDSQIVDFHWKVQDLDRENPRVEVTLWAGIRDPLRRKR